MKIFVQILLGIKHIHDLKCVHRNIKSLNILLTKNGNAKITDIGFSKILNSKELSSCKGSIFYISPEILTGQMSSFPTDIWSLGCVLYEMMSFNLPFDGLFSQFVQKVLKSPPKEIQKKYSKDLKKLILQMFK